MLGGRWPTIFAATAFATLFGVIGVVDGWWDVRTEVGGVVTPGGWIFEYQGLLGAILALGVAAITVAYLQKQIDQAADAAHEAKLASFRTLNQPTVERLNKLADCCTEAIGIAAEHTYLTGTIASIGAPYIDAEVTIDVVTFRRIAQYRNIVMDALREAEALEHGAIGSVPLKWRPKFDELVARAVAAMSRERTLALQIAFLLHRGWSPYQLVDKSEAEIGGLGEPPGRR